MAYTREIFKDTVEEKLSMALVNFYQFEISNLLQNSKLKERAQARIDKLVHQELRLTFLHSIRGFSDRNKAFLEVIDSIPGNKEKFFMRIAKGELKLYTKLSDATFNCPTDTELFQRGKKFLDQIIVDLLYS